FCSYIDRYQTRNKPATTEGRNVFHYSGSSAGAATEPHR
ncbi:unnamed protein product, partial [Amoebophrya sp. A120]